MAARSVFDVLVIGSGPGGLAAAGALARQLYSAVVFNSGVFRNARADHMHNFLGWDHQNPQALLQKARADVLKRYSTISFQDNTTISTLTKLENGHFEARDGDGHTWEGRKVVLAHGITDLAPNIPGYEECWGRTIFHCLFCHGYEERGAERAGVLATGDIASAPVAIHSARMARRLASNVTVYTHGSESLANEINAALEQSVTGIKADARTISSLKRLGPGDGVSVRFDDGSEVVHGFLVNKPKTRINGDFASQLGIELTEQGRYKVGQPFPETSVQGVFAVGDCSTMVEAVAVASSVGAMAGAGAAFQLLESPF